MPATRCSRERTRQNAVALTFREPRLDRNDLGLGVKVPPFNTGQSQPAACASARCAAAIRVASPTRRDRHSRLCGVTVAPTSSTTSVW
jgi:hypothetical protein